ncbi:MAG TPA: hypothetical protein VNG51_19265 [Ktedonobacteraceae bacterium]|nr:hypothetical protein [Ktedonobacteraceae bacterium]
MSLEIKQTLQQITEGFQANDEQAILPIYYGEELANGAAFNAFRFKRFMGRAGEVAMHSVELAGRFADHIANA